MESGFRLLLTGIVLVALAFSLMSVWPVLTETKPRNVPPQLKHPPTTFPTPPLSQPNPANAVAPQNQANRPSRQGPAGPSKPLGLVAKAPIASIEASQVYRWVYAKKRVTLYKEPSGEAHRANSINHSELEILAGTRLRSLRTDAGWLLVQSPSKLYGWVRDTDVSSRPPATVDTHWALFPSPSPN